MRWIALLGATAACAVWLVFIPWDRVVKGQNDFLGQYCGARLAGTALLHDAHANELEQQRAAAVNIPTEVFMRPDYYAALLWPLAQLPYRTAYALYSGLNLSALVLALYLMRERKDILMLGAVSIPVLMSFLNGQDLPIILAALMSAVVLDRRGRGVLGGLCLALCAIKPHLFIFVPVALIACRRWRMLSGATAGFAALFLLAVACQGWQWFPDYIALLRTPDLHPMPFPLPNLRGLAAIWPDAQFVIETGGAILVTLWLLYTAVQSSAEQFEHLLAMALAGGLLVAHHLGLHDCTMLLAVAALATVTSRPYKTAVMLAAPISYFVALLAPPISVLPALALAGGFFSPPPRREERRG